MKVSKDKKTSDWKQLISICPWDFFFQSHIDNVAMAKWKIFRPNTRYNVLSTQKNMFWDVLGSYIVFGSSYSNLEGQ